MTHRGRLVAFGTILLALGCGPGDATAPRARGAGPPQTAAPQSGVPEVAPDSFRIFPNVVVGGASSTPSGTVYVSATAPFDRTLRVASDNPAVLPFLSTATTLPAGSTRAGVQLLPATVSVETVVTVSVSGNGVTASATLTVEPPGTALPAPVLASLIANPLSVTAGTTATGTLTLTAPAPQGGVVIPVFSRIPSSAAVPATVTVPAGATSASFPITTFPGFPNSSTSVLLTAQSVNNLVSGSITVFTPGQTSAALGAPTLLAPAADQRFASGSSVTFDWSDVANASSYTIQISDQDKFTSFIATQTVAPSQFVAAGLPTKTMFWRVRANGASGNSGSWSSVRRFELK